MKQSSRLPEQITTLVEQIVPRGASAIVDQLARLRSLILIVNPKINLVSRKGTEQAIDDLIYDSTALLQFVTPADGDRVLDLGSGAGFPGLVWAVAFPRVNILSVEANRRKIEFQRQATRELDLQNVELINARIEELEPLEVDFAIAKAFASAEEACKLIAPHLNSGGELYLPRSIQEPTDQVSWTELGLELISIKTYQSATSGRRSHLIHTKKL